MITRFFDWLDNRTAYRRVLAPVRRRVLPSGPRWSYSLASCLLWLFVILLVTGLFLMTTYSPSTNSAWASVHYLEKSPYASFLRGLHYYAAQAMIVLFLVHVARVLLSAAFRAPRELIWISGLLLIPLTIIWAITGNPLSASLKGVSQIEVEGNILASTPGIGPIVKRILIGGEEVGHLTLTHLYFLHVGLMPLLVVGLLAVHLAQIYRHGLTPLAKKDEASSSRPYWPYQTIRNMAALTVMMSILGVLAYRYGAPLDAPADTALAHVPRPEWYFRSLFELRRYFTGAWEFIATMVVPGGTLLLLLAVPAIDRWFRPQVSFLFRLTLVVGGLGIWGALTYVSFARDWQDQEYLASVRQTDAWSLRARQIADHQSVPPEGAVALLRDDPKTQGPLLFERHCASCHPHQDEQGAGLAAADVSAPNLAGVGRVAWIQGFLDPDKIRSEHYFGKTKMAEGDMVSAIVDKFEALEDDDARDALREQLRLVSVALAAEAGLAGDASSAPQLEAEIASGRELLSGEMACTDCHRFHDQGDLGSAPDLTSYGSREWLTDMISNPLHERFYPEDRNDRMPAFAPDAHNPRANLLQPRELRLLVSWLRGEWFEP
ncbi:MAG: cytochrome b N-terminal domain-containing protein [Pirellulaceae bacterium]